jgi:murein DD-endopeptidase MepM/ murein hydrolase activator NlpD
VIRLILAFIFIFTFSGCSLFTSQKRNLDYYQSSKSAVKESQASSYIGQLLWPVEGKTRITSWFGPRSRSFHDGIDIVLKRGVPVLAAHDGVVLRTDNVFRGYGKLIVIKGQSLVTMYAHLDEYYVGFMDEVKRGDVIGILGASGRVTAPHLHFETRILNDKEKYYPVDPMVFYPDRS